MGRHGGAQRVIRKLMGFKASPSGKSQTWPKAVRLHNILRTRPRNTKLDKDQTQTLRAILAATSAFRVNPCRRWAMLDQSACIEKQ